jgi:hypothetical protein
MRAIVTLLACTAVLALSACRTIDPPAYVNTRKIEGTTPKKASRLVVIIDLALEASQSLARAPKRTYEDFAAHLQQELTKHGIEPRVVLNTERVLEVNADKHYDHAAILKLQSMYSSSTQGNRSRQWTLTILQRDTPQATRLRPLQVTQFVSDYEGCYQVQVTIQDNKAECRAKIVEFFVQQLQSSGILPSSSPRVS